MLFKAQNPRDISPQSSRSAVDIQKWKPLFLDKNIKVVWVRVSYLLDKKK